MSIQRRNSVFPVVLPLWLRALIVSGRPVARRVAAYARCTCLALNFRRLTIGILIVATLSGCSAVRVTYLQLDWLIANRIESYVHLNPEQRSVANQHIDALLAWHCRTQLRDYARWLRRVSVDFNNGLTPAQLDERIAVFEDAWQDLMHQVIPGAVDVFSSMRDDQLSEFFTRIESKNRAYRKKYLEPPESEWRRANKEWMQKVLRRWLGKPTEEQRRAVAVWADAIVPLREVGWASRMRWQHAFRSLLERRHDRQALVGGLASLLIDWEHYQDEASRRIYAHNRDLLSGLLISASRTTTPAQQRHFASRVERYAKDFDALACKKGKQ